MAKCAVLCAVILFMIRTSIAEDMTSDDDLQAFKDQILNVSLAPTYIKDPIVQNGDDYYNIEDDEYEYDEDPEDSDKPTLPPISTTQVDEVKTPKDSNQSDAIETLSSTAPSTTLSESEKKEIISTTVGTNNEDDEIESLAPDNISENLNDSEKDKQLTPINLAADFNETTLEIEELSVIPIPKVKAQPRIVSSMINITINSDEYTKLTSENFPMPYPDDAVIYEYTVGFGPGFGVEMIVKTIEFDEEDYLLVRPGGFLSSERQVLFSWYLKTEKKYKLLHLDELYISFVTRQKKGENEYRGFEIEFKRLGEIIPTTTPEPTEPPPVTVAPLNESVLYLGGKTPQQFNNISDVFRSELALIAEKYCSVYNISTDQNISFVDNVNYNLITRCTINWPESNKCVEVRYSIGVYYDNETGAYEMTVEHMDHMWELYGSEINLTRMGLTIVYPPNDSETFWLWFGISLGIIMIFLVVLLIMWKYRYFYQYDQTPSLRESLIYNRKSNLSLFPTPHQTVPPLYGHDTYDDNAWMQTDPPKYSGENKANYDGGQTNQGYVRNGDFNDLYSDDLIFMSLPDDQKQIEFGTLTHDDKIDNGESNS